MTAKSWEEIAGVYSDLIKNGWKLEKMHELVLHIKSSPYSNRLFGTTSLDKLILSIYNPIDPFKESLHISLDRNENLWSFQYFAIPFKEPEFKRTYDADKGIEKLDSFIKMIGW